MSNRTLPSLYIVTDRYQCKQENFLNILEELISQGGIMLQLREKDIPIRTLLQWTILISKWAKSYRVPFLINDRVDVVLATDADGVHLRENSLPVSKVRQCLGPNKLIGVSVHSVEEAVIRERDGADFIVFGPVYRTSSKRAYGPPLGLSKLEEATKKCHIPVFGIGGIQVARVREIRQAGAHGVAVISSIFQSSSPVETVRHFAAQLGFPK